MPSFPGRPEWTSGCGIASGADLLIHDAQYSPQEYAVRHGLGHSTVVHALKFAAMAGARRLVTFHHDPAHTDGEIDALLADAKAEFDPHIEVLPGQEGATFDVTAP